MYTDRPYADVLGLYDAARADADRFVRQAAAGDLGAATPCEGWDLRDLLTHLVEENRRFAAAVTLSSGASIAGPAGPGRSVSDPALAEAWDRSATELRAAFAAAEPTAPVRLEGFPPLTVDLALRMQLLDTVVHTWDVAQSVGQAHHPADELVDFVAGFAAAIAQRSPDGTPGVFAPPAPAADGDPWHRALADLGRRR